MNEPFLKREGVKWYPRFMRVALEVASWSDYPGGGNGAVLVSPDLRQVCFGMTGLPDGDTRRYEVVPDDEVIHAEENAILNSQCDLTGWSIYCSKAPCRRCAGRIIRARIGMVYCIAQPPESRWFNSCMAARDDLLRQGVGYKAFHESITEVDRCD